MATNVAQSSGKSTRRYRRDRHRPMSEINVTPFVDVMLVLLVIFMVTAPLLTVGVKVELPKTAANPLPMEREEPLTVAIDETGAVFVQNNEVDRSSLVEKLRAIALERTDRTVFLRASGSIEYESVMQVMGALNAGGFSDVSLVTDAGGPTLDVQEENG